MISPPPLPPTPPYFEIWSETVKKRRGLSCIGILIFCLLKKKCFISKASNFALCSDVFLYTAQNRTGDAVLKKKIIRCSGYSLNKNSRPDEKKKTILIMFVISFIIK